MGFKKVTFNVPVDGGFTLTGTDYIDDAHVNAFVSYQGRIGHPVLSVTDDDRPADADRTYTPPAYLTEGN